MSTWMPPADANAVFTAFYLLWKYKGGCHIIYVSLSACIYGDGYFLTLFEYSVGIQRDNSRSRIIKNNL